MTDPTPRERLRTALVALGYKIDRAQERIDDDRDRYGGTVSDAALLDALLTVLSALEALADQQETTHS